MLRQPSRCASLAETQEPAHTRFTTPDAHQLLSASLAPSGVFYVTGHVWWCRLMCHDSMVVRSPSYVHLLLPR